MTSRLKVGDRVRFHLGAHEVQAKVIEDRGMIGVGGRQIVRVKHRAMDAEWEMPAALVRRVS